MTTDGPYDTTDATDDASSPIRPVSRRLLIGGGAALGVGLAAVGSTHQAAAAPGKLSASWNGRSTRAAIRFLKGVTNAYRSSGPRLAQSYQDASGLRDTAFIYDNALAIIALLEAGEGGAARALGDGLLYAQTHDEKYTDGRLRQAYHADRFTKTAKTVRPSEFGLTGTAVGDMSWAGIALARLARATSIARYRTGALEIAQWIFDNTHSRSGLGGYTFGETAGLEDHKSTEHNIDVAAFFRMVHTLTGKSVWRARADHAWAFVEQVWNAEDEFFWTGSDDGTTINKLGTQLPLDAQTWSWLARRQGAYATALDWGASNLAVTDTPQRLNSALAGNQRVTGVAFGSGSLRADPTVPIAEGALEPDSAAVWFEGTAQLALALANRNRKGDKAAAQQLLDSVIWAQSELG
ncbi:MAG TPA: hypothetical protein VEX66_03420, partial [Microlunatus sp.]|nr:hypothetical protein [Microlunatus sp.]